LKDQQIVITNCEKVAPEFHARYSAKKRTYKYIILNRLAPPALDLNRVWHVRDNLDINKIIEASELLIGTHDFSSFRTVICQAKSPIKTLEYVKIFHDGERVIFELCAQSFLHHMVRNIVGALHLVGIGKFSKQDLQDYLNAQDINIRKYTAPACGLYFVRAEY